MENPPQPPKVAELSGRDTVRQVVRRDHADAHREQHDVRQVHQRGQRHHAHAQRPEHEQDERRAAHVEEKPRANDGELEDDEPETAREQEPGEPWPERSRRPGWPWAQERAGAGEKHERRRAEVRHPPGHEDGGGRAGQVLGLKRHRRGVHVVPRVIERHDDHDETAQDVQRLNTFPGGPERPGPDRPRRAAESPADAVIAFLNDFARIRV